MVGKGVESVDAYRNPCLESEVRRLVSAPSKYLKGSHPLTVARSFPQSLEPASNP